MKKFWIIVLCVVVLALAAGYIAANFWRGSDEDQINGVVESGRQAIQKKSVGMAGSCLSKNYSDEYGMNYDRIKMFALQAFHTESRYELAIDAPQIQVNGNQAEAKMHVSLVVDTSGARDEVFAGDIVLHFKKEKARRYYIYPVKDWKVTAISGIGKVFDFGG